MKRIVIVVVAVFAFGALMASMAFALPEISKQGQWTGKSKAGTTPTLTAAKKIVCKSATSAGGDTSASLGTFTIHFIECEEPELKVKCNSLGDAAGHILTGGEYHLVWDSLTTLGVAILFLPKPLHLECTSLVLILVESRTAAGGVLCLIKEPGTSLATHIFKCEVTGAVQKDRTYWNDKAEEQTEVLLACALNEGKSEACSEEAEGEITYPAAVSVLNV